MGNMKIGIKGDNVDCFAINSKNSVSVIKMWTKSEPDKDILISVSSISDLWLWVLKYKQIKE